MIGRQAAQELALRYLARRDRTEAQLLAFLEHRRVAVTHARAVVRQLRQQRYLDDERFARHWAAVRLARRPMGRQRLEAELIAQGIGAALAARIADDAYRTVDEAQLARRVLSAGGGGAARLRRYGFSEEIIESVIAS